MDTYGQLSIVIALDSCRKLVSMPYLGHFSADCLQILYMS